MKSLGWLPVVLLAASGAAEGCGASGGDGGGAAYANAYSQPSAPLCDVLKTFVASAKDPTPFATMHADAITDYLWHTHQRPEDAMSCTVSRQSAEAGDPTILCEYDGKADPHGIQQMIAGKAQACLQGGDWQASADDSTEASAWFSNASAVKVSVYVLPAQGGKLDVMLDLDPLPASSGAPPATSPAASSPSPSAPPASAAPAATTP